MNSRTMDCRRARRLLSDRLNRPPEPLPPAQGAALEAHLRGCAACDRFDRQLRATPARFRALPAVPPNPRVLAALERRVVTAHQGGFRAMRHRIRQGIGPVAATLFLVAASAFAVALLRPGPAGTTGGGGPTSTTVDVAGVPVGAPPPPATAPSPPTTPTSQASAPPAVLTPLATTPTADTWAALRQRPLAVPTLAPGSPCPRTEGTRVSRAFSLAIGGGPAYATGLGPDGAYGYLQSGDDFPGYVYQSVLADASAQGPLLVRGRQLDGPGTLAFASNPSQRLPELTLGPGGEQAHTVSSAPGWRQWPVYTIAPTPGCYAYQLDGTSFSETIVFQIVPGRPADLLPLPAAANLPQQMSVASAVPLGDGRVRVALTGASYLALRLDVSPAAAAMPTLEGPNIQHTDSGAGPVVWRADPANSGRPQEAVWGDGRQGYHLTVLDGDPGAWSADDLLALVKAFAGAR